MSPCQGHSLAGEEPRVFPRCPDAQAPGVCLEERMMRPGVVAAFSWGNRGAGRRKYPFEFWCRHRDRRPPRPWVAPPRPEGPPRGGLFR